MRNRVLGVASMFLGVAAIILVPSAAALGLGAALDGGWRQIMGAAAGLMLLGLGLWLVVWEQGGAG